MDLSTLQQKNSEAKEITAHKAALEPIDKSISPAIMQIVKAKPTRPNTANRSRMAKEIL